MFIKRIVIGVLTLALHAQISSAALSFTYTPGGETESDWNECIEFLATQKYQQEEVSVCKQDQQIEFDALKEEFCQLFPRYSMVRSLRSKHSRCEGYSLYCAYQNKHLKGVMITLESQILQRTELIRLTLACELADADRDKVRQELFQQASLGYGKKIFFLAADDNEKIKTNAAKLGFKISDEKIIRKEDLLSYSTQQKKEKNLLFFERDLPKTKTELFLEAIGNTKELIRYQKALEKLKLANDDDNK